MSRKNWVDFWARAALIGKGVRLTMAFANGNYGIDLEES